LRPSSLEKGILMHTTSPCREGPTTLGLMYTTFPCMYHHIAEPVFSLVKYASRIPTFTSIAMHNFRDDYLFYSNVVHPFFVRLCINKSEVLFSLYFDSKRKRKRRRTS
jgi:hypothetical protein